MPSRALALALATLLLAGGALAQVPDRVDPPQSPESPEQLECQAPVEECFPDLLPSNPRAQIRDERFPLEACTDFVNLGNGPSAVPLRVLLKIDNVAIGEREFDKVYRRGEGEAQICWNDITVTKGRHTMTVFVDSDDQVIETNENNNIRSITFTVRAKPETDLELTSLIVLPREGGPGQVQTFLVNVSNIGAAASNATTVDLADETGELVTWQVPSLGPGQSMSFALPTRPDIRPVGTFIARAVIDPIDNVSELSEENNEALAEYTVLDHPAPDFRIQNVSTTGNLTAMRGIRFDVLVENIGDRGVRGTTVRIVDEENRTLAVGSTRNIILANQSALVQFTLVPKFARNYTLRFIADPQNLVNERDERNNEWVLNFTVTEPVVHRVLPNLVVDRIYVTPEDPRPGETLSLGALVRNVGLNRSNETKINFTVDGRVVASTNVPALRPDASYSAYVPWTTGSKDGAYVIRAIADPDQKIDELDDGDNDLSRDFLVTVEKPPVQEEKPPVVVTPPVPTPVPPTPAKNTTKPPTNVTPPKTPSERVVFGEIILSTRPVPGGVRGVVSASLRNPNIEPIPLMTVAFKVDGELLKEVFVSNLRGAASTAATTGEIDLPPGKHTVTAEVYVVGVTGPPVTRSKEYDQAADKKPIPGFELVGLVGALALAMVVARRRNTQKK